MKFLLVIILLLIWPLILFFAIPLEMQVGSTGPLLFIAFVLFVAGFVQVLKLRHTALIIASVCVFIFLVVVIWSPLTENLFLGKLIGQEHAAEAPGYTEIKVYDKGKCKLITGGLFSESGTYHTYIIKDSILYVADCENLFDLSERDIAVQGKVLQLKALPEKQN